MKLIRYILSHGLLLAFIVVLVLAYQYRTHLFSNEVNARIESVSSQVVDNQVVNKVQGWFEVFSTKEETASESTETASAEQPAIAEPSVETEATQAETVISTEPVATQVVQEETQAVTAPPASEPSAATTVTETQIAQADSQPVAEPQQADPNEQPHAEVESVQKITVPTTEQPVDIASTTTSAPADQGDSTGETATVAEDDRAAAQVSHMAMLEQARQAFSAGNPDRAISLYQELADLNPDDPNIFGELGNIFYSQGKWKQAGTAYYEAASRLLDRGHTGQVQYLYRVIQGLDQESAEKLAGRLGR